MLGGSFVPINFGSWFQLWTTVADSTASATRFGIPILALVCGISIFKIIVGYFL